MTREDLVFKTRTGRKLGPLALAVLYAVDACGGVWVGKDAKLAAALGCTAAELKRVRTALVARDVLSYTFEQRGGLREYRTRTAAVEKVSDATGETVGPKLHSPTTETDPLAPPSQLALGTTAAGGQEAPPSAVVKKGRTPQPTDDLFDQIVAFAFGGVRPKQGGRIAKVAHEIHAAGVSAERLRRELPKVVGRYAKWREHLDLGTIEACWRWVIAPPVAVPKGGNQSAAQLAAEAFSDGNPWAVKPTPTEEME